MSRLEERRAFLKRLSKNLDHIDKKTLLTHLWDESDGYESLVGLLQLLDEGILIVSDQGEVELMNSSAQKILGLSAKPGQPFWADLEDLDLKSFFEQQLKRVHSDVLQTVRVLSPQERNLKIHIHPKVLGKPARHLISITDLTHSLLPEVERMARRRFEALIRLTGGLAHEIGNPLNAMSLHSEILKKQIEKLTDSSKDRLQDTVQIIQDEIRRLDRIVRNFLKTTRRTPLRFQMLNLSGIIQDVLRVMKPSLEEHDIRLEVSIPDRVEFFLDEERMRSLFMNLIQNAIEAMPDGGCLTIQVSAKGQTARIQIQDTGKGIDAQDLPHIFEAYFTTKEHGSGLGLMFVYDAIHDHGGKINVQSRLGKGTCFEMTLPLRRSNLQIHHTANQTTGD